VAPRLSLSPHHTESLRQGHCHRIHTLFARKANGRPRTGHRARRRTRPWATRSHPSARLARLRMILCGLRSVRRAGPVKCEVGDDPLRVGGETRCALRLRWTHSQMRCTSGSKMSLSRVQLGRRPSGSWSNSGWSQVAFGDASRLYTCSVGLASISRTGRRMCGFVSRRWAAVDLGITFEQQVESGLVASRSAQCRGGRLARAAGLTMACIDYFASTGPDDVWAGRVQAAFKLKCRLCEVPLTTLKRENR